MALSATCKRAMNVALASYGTGLELSAAVDANTLKTSMTTITELSTSTSEATTTWLRSRFNVLVANMQAGGHMA